MSEKTWLHWSGWTTTTTTLASRALTMSEKTWLHWSINQIIYIVTFIFFLPCLKRHGSIEASLLLHDHKNQESYHVWKDMAPLKLTVCEYLSPSGFYLPCLKRHGSIEALFGIWKVINKYALTMSEKTWLHWSQTVSHDHKIYPVLTMSEKTWLHWSAFCDVAHGSSVNPYHVWKDMAPLKLKFHFM